MFCFICAFAFFVGEECVDKEDDATEDAVVNEDMAEDGGNDEAVDKDANPLETPDSAVEGGAAAEMTESA